MQPKPVGKKGQMHHDKSKFKGTSSEIGSGSVSSHDTSEESGEDYRRSMTGFNVRSVVVAFMKSVLVMHYCV